MKNIYCQKKYLFETDCSDVSLSIIRLSQEAADSLQEYTEMYNLFDCNMPCKRKINITFLDEQVDTLEKLRQIVNIVIWVDELIIINDRHSTDNPIIQEFSEYTLKSYVYLLMSLGIKKVIIAEVVE